MGATRRRITRTLAAVSVVAAVPFVASTAERSYTKYWSGVGGATVCAISYTGQSFPAQEGTNYRVDVVPVIGSGPVQAVIRFYKKDATWTAPTYFEDTSQGQVPLGAVESWVTICHTTDEVSYGIVVVPLPCTIVFTDGS